MPGVALDEWVVMPNHVHGILVVKASRGVQLNAPTTPDSWRDQDNPFSVMSPRPGTIGVVIRTYKAAVTARCRKADFDFQWQRNYYDRIVRNEGDLRRIREYIRTNPQSWLADEYHPETALRR